ncbi:uncharacterized protein LOC135686832 isoform X2 [Rhopilema esculentum]|uniref:uncharacterized protein LOC135686832 isoform X2 n=1 Tax=Rhopilema esculentum TaxID=499914 RepID=UPI0031D7823B
MIKTIIWFAGGGLFTACFANAFKNAPLFKKPSRHILFTLAGLAIGYRFHLFEENSEDLYKELIKKHKNAPWYDRGVLLAEKASKGDEDETDDFEDLEDDEGDEDEE